MNPACFLPWSLLALLTCVLPSWSHHDWARPIFGTNVVWTDGNITLTRNEMRELLYAAGDESWNSLVAKVQDSALLRQDLLRSLPELCRTRPSELYEHVQGVAILFVLQAHRNKLSSAERRTATEEFLKLAVVPDEDLHEYAFMALAAVGNASDTGQLLALMTNGAVKETWALPIFVSWGATSAIPEIERRYRLAPEKAARGDQASAKTCDLYRCTIASIRSNAPLVAAGSASPLSFTRTRSSLRSALLPRLLVGTAIAALAAAVWFLRRRRSSRLKRRRGNGSGRISRAVGVKQDRPAP